MNGQPGLIGAPGGPALGEVSPQHRNRVLAELVGLWLVTLLLIRGVVAAQAMGLPDVTLAAVPFLFIYVPVGLCRLRGVDSFDYRLGIPAFDDRAAWRQAFTVVGTTILLVTIPWLIGYHLYQTLIFHFHPVWRIPKDAWLLVPYHLLFVALPEEFFYRGYIQTRLNEVFPKKVRVLGVMIGWALPIGCLFFAFGHSLVVFRWWHFATFFPGLLFGWMREKTGQPVAGAMFHAWCNVTVNWLDTIYGIIG